MYEEVNRHRAWGCITLGANEGCLLEAGEEKLQCSGDEGPLFVHTQTDK